MEKYRGESKNDGAPDEVEVHCDNRSIKRTPSPLFSPSCFHLPHNIYEMNHTSHMTEELMYPIRDPLYK